MKRIMVVAMMVLMAGMAMAGERERQEAQRAELEVILKDLNGPERIYCLQRHNDTAYWQVNALKAFSESDVRAKVIAGASDALDMEIKTMTFNAASGFSMGRPNMLWS